MFTLSQKTFWISLILITILVSTICAIGQVVSFIVIREMYDSNTWGKRDAKSGLVPLELPVTRVVVVDTADERECCMTPDECVRRLQVIQILYMDKYQLKDIPFNFMIGCDGIVYKGRGFESRGERFIPPDNLTGNLIATKKWTRKASSYLVSMYEEPIVDFLGKNLFIVAFIGNFTEQKPSDKQLQTFSGFLDRSVSRDVMTHNFTLMTQKQIDTLNNTADALTEALSTIPHFTKIDLGRIFRRRQWLSQKYFDMINFSDVTPFTGYSSNVILEQIPGSCISLVS